MGVLPVVRLLGGEWCGGEGIKDADSNLSKTAIRINLRICRSESSDRALGAVAITNTCGFKKRASLAKRGVFRIDKSVVIALINKAKRTQAGREDHPSCYVKRKTLLTIHPQGALALAGLSTSRSSSPRLTLWKVPKRGRTKFSTSCPVPPSAV